MGRAPVILICDDDSVFHLAVKQTLKGKYECKSAFHSDEARAILRNHPIDLVLLDVQMRTPDEGLRAIPILRALEPDLAIVMSSGLTDFKTVKEAMRLGAADYIPKDFNPEELLLTIERVLGTQRLLLKCERQNFEAAALQRQHVLVGGSPAMQSLQKSIEKIRASQANVLITGETGTGKEVVARLLRKTLPDGTLEPFLAVDSSTIQSTMAESLLFGHEKGAFTGADSLKKGIFEEADGGIVYFDELANMPLEIQAKLLRVIQEKEITRLGSSKVIPLDFRVICATNRDLEEEVRAGRFKADVFQRLNVLPIQLPPLRERREDIPELIGHFLSKQPGTSGRIRFLEAAVETLKTYSWPGNVRELSNVIQYIVAMLEGTEVDVSDLPPALRAAGSVGHPAVSRSEGDFYSQVASFEKGLLAAEFKRAEGSVSKMALRLSMDRSHLYTKLREHGIHQPKKC